MIYDLFLNINSFKCKCIVEFSKVPKRNELNAMFSYED